MHSLVRQASKLSIFHLSYLADTSNKKSKLVAGVSGGAARRGLLTVSLNVLRRVVGEINSIKINRNYSNTL